LGKNIRDIPSYERLHYSVFMNIGTPRAWC